MSDTYEDIGELCVELEHQNGRLNNEVARLRQALEFIACTERPDGTYNRDRRACELLAKDALKAEIEKPVVKDSLTTEPTPEWRDIGLDEVIQEGDEVLSSKGWIPAIRTGRTKLQIMAYRTRRPLPKPKLELELKAEIK